MQDRRKAQRWPAYLGGQAIFFHRQSTADVLIRNTSGSGAKLVVGNSDFIPDEFSLKVARKEREYRVQTRWRRGDNIGIQFC